MASTLTGAGELTYASFPIDKVETDADGDLIVYGKASDGSIDSDQQIVAPAWMSSAAQAWKESGANLRVQHNPQRDPAGIGLEVETDSSGATWVKGLVVEPIAKKLVAKGALRAYSVGIAHPTIERDVTGKARGGIITGGELVEISLVDRPANKRCGIQLVKSADDGTPEYVNEVFGAEADIAKALGADVTKGADDDFVNVDLPKGASISISPSDFAKLRTFKQELVTKGTAVADTEKRDVSTAERRSLASEGNALPDGSYPINSTGDLSNAAHLARTGHGDAAAARRLIARRARELGVANPLDESDGANKSASGEEGSAEGIGGNASAAVMAAAAKFALTPEDVAKMPPGGLAALLTADKALEEAEALKEAEPEVTKDPESEAKDKPVKKKAKKPKKLPPWLNKPDDDGKGSDDDGDADDAAKSCKGAHAWIHVGGDSPVPDIRCEKCHTTPAEAAGLSGSHDMNPAPVPELLESPPMASTKGSPDPQSASDADEAAPMDPAPSGELADTPPPASAKDATEAGMMKSSPEVAALMRFKRAGIDTELGRLHDLTCPAFHPEDVAKCHPFADFRSAVDEAVFQRKAVEAACGPDRARMDSLNVAWQAARVLKEAPPADLNQYRLEAHKAFRDANPGPSSAPTPGMMTPGRYNRPLVTDGHEASSAGHDGPNSSPAVATNAPNAHSFDRPPLAAGHQSPSPSFMKASFEYPSEPGQPMRLDYAVMEKDRARHALMQMHEHLSRQFPEACPISQDSPQQPESRGVPPTAGIGKGEGVGGNVPSGPGDAVPAMLDSGYVVPAPVAAAFKAPVADDDMFADAEVYKGFKKMRKKLGKKVLSGSMTVDEARTKLGRQFAQKGSDEQEAVAKGIMSADEVRARLDLPSWGRPDGDDGGAVPAFAPGGPVPAAPAVAKAIDPEVIKAAVTEATADLRDLLVKQQHDMAAQQETFTTRLAEQQKVIDAIADQPDPSTAAFSGLAFNPLRTKAARPAGVATQAEIAERTQHMVMRTLQEKVNSSSDPYEREAYYTTLSKMRGFAEP